MIIQAPVAHNGPEDTMYLCGDAGDWQDTFLANLSTAVHESDLVVVDPRFGATPVGAPAYYQWFHMRKAHALVFWLDNPDDPNRVSTIYNIGKYLTHPHKQIFVGMGTVVDELVTHAAIERPNLFVVNSPKVLAIQVSKWYADSREQPVTRPKTTAGQHVEI